jgi:pimeloyl-ACP methyl ester carboxylesterase
MRHISRFRRVLVLLALVSGLLAGSGVQAAVQPRSFHVQIVGKGQPMILIPGLASSGDTWTTTVARYQDRYTCYVLTLSGFAGQPPIDAPLFATARAELADYIRENGLVRPTIVGHSLGGTLALALAVDHPDLVGPLVIVDALPFLAGAQMSAKTVEDARPQIAAMRAYMTAMTRPQYNEYVETGAATKFLVTSAADHDVIKGWSRASDPRTVGNAMADLYGVDLRADVSRISSPTLLLGSWTGISEQVKSFGMSVTRSDVIREFEQQFTGLRQLHFALAEEARHFIMFDSPQWFFDQVDAFLAHPAESTRDRGLPEAK